MSIVVQAKCKRIRSSLDFHSIGRMFERSQFAEVEEEELKII